MRSMEQKVEQQLPPGEFPGPKATLIHDEVGYVVLDYVLIEICTDVIGIRTAPEMQRCRMRMKRTKIKEGMGKTSKPVKRKAPESQGYYEAKASGRWQVMER